MSTVLDKVTDIEMVVLDFGEWGSVTVPPAVAESFVADQGVRDRIRTECRRARREQERRKSDPRRN